VKDMNETMASIMPLRDYVRTYREAAWRASSNIQVCDNPVRQAHK
jgi:hypothetical protein